MLGKKGSEGGIGQTFSLDLGVCVHKLFKKVFSLNVFKRTLNALKAKLNAPHKVVSALCSNKSIYYYMYMLALKGSGHYW